MHCDGCLEDGQLANAFCGVEFVQLGDAIANLDLQIYQASVSDMDRTCMHK